MAKPVTEEELQLRKRARRRLIGAIALVAVVSAVLPMVLDTDPKPTSTEVNIQIPSPDAKMAPPGKQEKMAEAKTVAKAEPAKEEKAAEAPVAAPVPEERPAPKATEKVPEKDAAEKVPEKKAPEKKAAEKASEAAADKPVKPKPGTFYIQVAALAEAEKARAVQEKIAAAGVRAYTVIVTSGGVKMTRVRAGPFATHEEAERARSQLVLIGLDGKVAAN